MRTTVDIPDTTYRLLKSKAAAEGGTVKQLVLLGVEMMLREARGSSAAKAVPRLVAAHVRTGKPGSIPALTNAELYDLIDFP